MYKNLFAKDPFETKHNQLINNFKRVDLIEYNASQTFIKYLNDMNYIYTNVEE